MKRMLLPSLAALSLLLSISFRCQAERYGPGGFQGRIALSHDGNFNDEDDWGAFPVAVACLTPSESRTGWCTSSTTTSSRRTTTGSRGR